MTARPSEFAEVTTLPIYIRDVSGSNLGRGADYPEVFFVVFLSLSRRMPGEYIKL
jgi:hypothetical protein